MADSIAIGPSEPALIDETIGARLEATAAKHPGREALVVSHQDVRLTWAELDAKIDAVARGLMALGIEAGDRVGMWSPNFAEWVYIQFATAKIGAIQVNVNPAYRTSELEYALRQSGCKALVTMTSYLTSRYREMVEEVAPHLDALERVVYFDTDDWSDLLAAGRSVPDAELRARTGSLDPMDPINIQYTSGTTGFPKGATLSHRNILNNAQFVGAACGHTAEDRVCISVPFYHCFGMVMGNLACCVHGSTMVVPCPSFEPRAVLEAVQAERCTSLYGVPTMFIAELSHPDVASFDLGTLRTGIMAGSPCPIETMKRVIDEMNMSEVTIAYGMTETSPVSTQTGADDPIEEFLHGAPGVMDVHVIGVPDEKFGEELNAWVQLAPGVETTEADLRADCEGRIARHKVPRYFTFVTEFPMTVTGKVRKVEMRERAIEDLGLTSAAKIENA